MYGFVGQSIDERFYSLLKDDSKEERLKNVLASPSTQDKFLLDIFLKTYFKSESLHEGDMHDYDYKTYWKNRETTLIIQDNVLWVVRGNKENLYFVDCKKKLNQIWVTSNRRAFVDNNLVDESQHPGYLVEMPPFNIWRLRFNGEWKINKFKIKFNDDDNNDEEKQDIPPVPNAPIKKRIPVLV